MKAPLAEKISCKLTQHNDTRVDNYYWLRERNNPKVTAYLNAENKYLKAKLAHTNALQKTLFKEIVNRIQPEDASVPYLDNGFYYYERYEKGSEHPLICRKADRANAKEELLIDSNKLAKGQSYFDLGDYAVSSDNKIIAYSTDCLGRRFYTIYFKTIATGKIQTTILPNTEGSIVWAKGSKLFFFVKKDLETLRDYQVFRQNLDTPNEQAQLVFEEKNQAFNVEIDQTKSEKYILINSMSTTSTEVLYLDSSNPIGKFKVFQKRAKNLEYIIEHHTDSFYILSNLNRKNFDILKTPISNTEKEHWKSCFEQKKSTFVEEFDVFEKHIVITERKDALIKMRIIDLTNGEAHYLDFGEPAYEAWISDNSEFNSQKLRFGYSSMTTPTSYFDYDMESKKKALLKQQKVEGNFDTKNYTTERLYAIASDGVKIPISIVYKTGVELSNDKPLLLYAYGSYGYSSDVYFSAARLSLLNRGFIYAIAHVRGGQEKGRVWYEDGKLLNKKHTFTDFITCTKFLQDKGYSKPEKTFAEGGSAGGLLMGVVANMSPKLYAGIIAEVPFVDVLTTMLDDTIPLTTGEYEEWGNPNNIEFYKYIKSYSPYDCIARQEYPAMLITTGLHDSQVQYWEPAKWVAKLRIYNTSSNNIFLYTNMKTGHSGASGRFEVYKEVALSYAFMLDILNALRRINS